MTVQVVFAVVVLSVVVAVPAAYALALLGQALVLPKGGFLLRTIPLIALTHVLYGLGFWRGLLTRLRSGKNRPPISVTLERIPLPRRARGDPHPHGAGLVRRRRVPGPCRSRRLLLLI